MNSPLPLMLCPARIIILLSCRSDDGGLHQRAGLDRDRLLSELRGDNLEQLAVEPVRHQQSPEPHEGRPLRRRLMPGKAAKPAKGGSIIKRFSQLHIGQTLPDRQQQKSPHNPPTLLPTGQTTPICRRLLPMGDLKRLTHDELPCPPQA